MHVDEVVLVFKDRAPWTVFIILPWCLLLILLLLFSRRCMFFLVFSEMQNNIGWYNIRWIFFFTRSDPKKFRLTCTVKIKISTNLNHCSWFIKKLLINKVYHWPRIYFLFLLSNLQKTKFFSIFYSKYFYKTNPYKLKFTFLLLLVNKYE